VPDRQEANSVSQPIELTPPEVSRPACLHENGGSGLLAHEPKQLAPGQSVLLADPTWVVGDGELENGLGKIDREDGILHGGLLLVPRTVLRPGTMMPYAPPEESMSSMDQVATARPQVMAGARRTVVLDLGIAVMT